MLSLALNCDFNEVTRAPKNSIFKVNESKQKIKMKSKIINNIPMKFFKKSQNCSSAFYSISQMNSQTLKCFFNAAFRAPKNSIFKAIESKQKIKIKSKTIKNIPM